MREREREKAWLLELRYQSSASPANSAPNLNETGRGGNYKGKPKGRILQLADPTVRILGTALGTNTWSPHRENLRGGTSF